MFNWLGKVRLDKVLLSYNYKYCQRALTFSQGLLKLTCATTSHQMARQMLLSQNGGNIIITSLLKLKATATINDKERQKQYAK